jgi:hypothetical protein
MTLLFSFLLRAFVPSCLESDPLSIRMLSVTRHRQVTSLFFDAILEDPFFSVPSCLRV